MKERMKQMFTGETLAVSDQPAVQEAQHTFDEARLPYETIRQRVAELDRLCMPVVDSSDSREAPPDRLTVLQAQARLPALRLELWEREAALEQARKVHLRTVTEATAQLETARQEPRRALVRELFDKMDEAKEVAEQIAAFDLETRALGGKPPVHPFGELLDEPHRQGMVSFRRDLFEKDGSL